MPCTPGAARRTRSAQRTPLIDGIEKVTGRARYTADLPFGDALVGRDPAQPGRARRDPRHRHRRARARCPACAPSITGEDFAAPYGVIPIAQNEWPLARDKVRYRGEPLAAVAAVDEATARRGARRDRARHRAAAGVLQRRRRARRRTRCRCTTTSPATSSARSTRRSATSTPASPPPTSCASRRSTTPRSRTARSSSTPRSPSYEPERDRLTTHSVTQVPYYLHLTLAQMPRHGRLARSAWSSPSSAAASATASSRSTSRWSPALLARAAGGTVKLELSREDGFLTHRGRPETDIRLKIGMKKTGEITAVDCEVVAARRRLRRLRAGDDPLRRRAAARALHGAARCKYRGYRVYTNTPPCGAMRGHGAVDARHAFESLLDSMAGELGLDPFAVRRANLIAPPYRTINDLQVNSYGLPAMPRLGRAGLRLEASGAASCRAGAGLGHGVLALRLGLGQAGALERRAARGDQPQARLRRRHHDAHRRVRHRPGLVDAARAGRRRGAARCRWRASASSPPTAR